MYALVDRFRNDLVLSRHRTVAAAARASLKHGRALREYNKGALNGASLRVERNDGLGINLDFPSDADVEEFAQLQSIGSPLRGGR